MAVTSHQLQLFYTVAEKGSFSAAAQALHMTQPAVTMQIQSLEDYFGCKLFIRSSKRIELTEAGRILIPYAERSLNVIREAEQAMSAFAEKIKGRLVLGASLTIGEHILPQWLGSFSAAHPEITLQLHILNTSQLIDATAAHELHLALVEAPVNHPSVRSEAVMDDELVLVLPAGHPLLAQEIINIQDLKSYPLILREAGSGTRIVLEEALAAAGEQLSNFFVQMELGSTGTIKSAVEQNLGISFLSRTTIRHEEALGLLIPREVSGFRLRRQFFSIMSPSTPMHYPATLFLTFLRQRGVQK